MTDLKSELRNLYEDSSKHSTYQNIPDFVSVALGFTESIDEGWRGDRPRLAYLLAHRHPEPNETWLDFGANTGFFTLSLAHKFPRSRFVAVEANSNHARFIERVVEYFELTNVEVISGAIGYRELRSLPYADVLLHLNVLHHAGHDFDADLVPDRTHFEGYARSYLEALRSRAGTMLFQMGSNWGGDKRQPLVAVHEDIGKLRQFSTWLRTGGWHTRSIAYPHKQEGGRVVYQDVDTQICRELTAGTDIQRNACDMTFLDAFPGEFYRRPLFLCRNV